LPVEDAETENDIVNCADDEPNDEDIPLVDTTENRRKKGGGGLVALSFACKPLMTLVLHAY
jgi:hypothetical protein